jgi:hypothetical protein
LSRHRAPRWAALAITLVVVAGCGSTVENSGAGTSGLAVSSGSGSGAGLGGVQGTGFAGSTGATTASNGRQASVTGSVPPGTTPAFTGGSSANGPAGPTASNGPGVTAKTITIGVSYYQSGAAANEALGAKGVSTGDPVAETRVLIAAINKMGGIAGRTVSALFYAIDPQSSTPYATEAQAECTYFTQDHGIFALIDGTPAADARACLGKSGVADLRGPIVTAALTGNEVDAYSSLLSRAFSAMVPSLVRQGWFSPWDRVTGFPGTSRAKIGIVTADDIDDNRAVDGVLIPALRKIGYAPASNDVIRINPPAGFSDDAATVAAIDNAALKLNADGVDHVILNDNNGSLSLLFNNYAYSQNYFPRYGGTSGNAWQVLLSAGDIRAKTLQGAIGIGWQPLFDVPFQQGDGPYSNAARHHCFALFSSVGMSQTDAGTAGGQAEGCDVAFLLVAALHGYVGPVNLTVLLNRVEGLGSSYPLASGFASNFGPSQHDGNGAFLAMQFDGGCSCMRYDGSVQPMPR